MHHLTYDIITTPTVIELKLIVMIPSEVMIEVIINEVMTEAINNEVMSEVIINEVITAPAGAEG